MKLVLPIPSHTPSRPAGDGCLAWVRYEKGVGTVRYPCLVPRDADCAAYGWPADLSDEPILERLLALNFQGTAEEENAAKAPKLKAQRTKQGGELV